MTLTTSLLIALGAAVGAPTRFVVDRYLNGSWPRGTLLVNVVGSFVLGVASGYAIHAAEPPKAILALVGIGFCGSLTTFGGFAAQTVDLFSLGRSGTGSSSAQRNTAYLYASASVLGCVVAGWIGLLIAFQIWPGL
jgi:CrcB protein